MSKILTAVLSGAPPVLKGYTYFTSAFQLMVKQRNALIKDDWKTLDKLANQGLGNAYGVYREMCRSVGVLQAQSDEANEALISFLKSHAKDKETRQEFYAKLKEQLLKTRPDLNEDWLKALDALAEGKVGDNVILEGLKKRQAETPDKNESAIEATVALALRSLMALTYAGFHNHYKQISKYPFIAHKDELMDVIQAEVDVFENQIESSLKKLHSNITQGLALQGSCENLTGMLEQLLPSFGRTQATIRLYAITLKDGGMETASEKAGKIAAKAGDLTRMAFTAYAAAYYLSLQSRIPQADPKIKKVLNPEADLKYNAKFPNGKNFQISKIDKAKDGDYVEVGGFVSSVTSRRESNAKLISQVTLQDPSDKAMVDAAGVYVHMRHVGLQEGAYCVLHGTWQSQSNINKNKPAVEIDKLSINELSKSSWKTQFLDLADKFYERWPGGLHITYGLSPHVSGGKEGKSDILGAGELIFKPFTR